MKTSSITVHRAAELPAGEHWAILEEDCYVREDYGETSTHYFVRYDAFTNEDEFKTELQRRMEANAKYSFGHREVRGIHVQATFTPKTIVQVEEQKS